MPTRLPARPLVAAALLFALAATTIPAAHAAPAATKRRAGKHKRCKRGRVQLRLRHHRHRCVKVKRPKHVPATPSVHRLRTEALRDLPRLRVRGAHGRRVKAPRLPKSLLRALSKGEQSWPAAARAARVHPRAHASLKIGGWDVDFSTTGDDATTMTVHKGKQYLKLTVSLFPTVGECPDAEGTVKGKAPYVFNVDGEFKTDKAPDGWPEVATKPASAFVHVTSALHVDATSHDDDGAHLVDYDVRGKDTEYLQVGLKDGHGKVLATNAPNVVSVTFNADHVKPPVDGEAWTKDVLARSHYAAHLTGQSDWKESLQGPILKWVLAVEKVGQAYQAAEAEHWQKDCLQIAGTKAPAKLRSNQHGQVVITGVSARGGALKGPVALTMTANAAVSPASATWVGSPIPLDYTAPASRAWFGEGVTVRAVSKMGVGSQSFGFDHDKSASILRITSRITRDLSPYGSATYDLTSEVPLQLSGGDGPPTASGSAPLTWNTFEYHDDGEQEYCQSGAIGVNDYDGVGAEPGAIAVAQAFPFDPYTVSFTITPPVEHYVSYTRYNHNDPHPCNDVRYEIDHTLWFNGLSALAGLPDVKVDALRSTWTVGGFHDGTGDVEKYRDLDAGPVHMRIELVQAY
ncbi:MAG TPA: hypothetical protein VFG79_22870 [Solirubrobacter sp.]|nr:hypothetical protein [Solirubrobacter sp.]